MKRTLRHFIVLAVIFLSIQDICAQSAITTRPGDKKKETTLKPKPDSLKRFSDSLVKVLANYKKQPATYTITQVKGLGSRFHGDSVFSMDEYLVLTMKEDLDSLLKINEKDPLMLRFNNIAFTNLKIWKVNKCSRELIFKVIRDTSLTSAWNIFYSYQYRGLFGEPKLINLALGTEKRCLSNNFQVTLNITEEWMRNWGIFFILIILFAFFYFVTRNDLLRDSQDFDDSVMVVKELKGSPDERLNQVLKKDLPYSLARTQLAFWTLLAAVSFIFIWANTDELATISTTTAILIGISGGASIIGKIVDKERSARSAVKMNAAAFNGKFKSEGFLKDILSDSKGLSVSKLQLVVFTMILGIYFLWYVIYNLSMPNFSDTLLLLVGISNTTYAGVKFTDN
jgi:hypothetical protein